MMGHIGRPPNPTVPGFKEKWLAFCEAVRPLGRTSDWNSRRFQANLLAHVRKEMQGRNVNIEDSSSERLFDGWLESGKPADYFLDWMVRIAAGLSKDILVHGSVAEFETHVAAVASLRLMVTLDKLDLAMDLYREERPELQRWALESRADGAAAAGWADFPLLIGKGYILKEPKEARVIDGLLLPLSHDSLSDADPSMSAGLHPDHMADNAEYRSDYRVRKLHKSSSTWSGYSYRLAAMSVENDVHALSFSRSRYRTYVNTCESRALEAAFFRVSEPELPASLISIPSASSARAAGPDVFTLGNRNAMPGINTITILLDESAEARHQFIVHWRGIEVDEAINTLHMVPAGGFQPLFEEGILSQQEDACWEREEWNTHLSIELNVQREYIEECLNLEHRIREDARRGDWRDGSTAAAKAYRKLQAAMQMSPVPDAKVFYFGMGFDPLTNKPEMLTAMVMRRTLYLELRDLADQDRASQRDISEEYARRFNYEGKGFSTDFTKADLDEQKRQPNRWLSAGLACLECARKHYDFLVSSLDEPTA